MAFLFIIILSIFIYKKRKDVKLEKLLFPIFYIIMYRSKTGIKFIDRFAEKHKNGIQLFGYTAITAAIFFMLYAFFNILVLLWVFIKVPEIKEGAALILPFTNVAGIGYLGFLHFIIALFLIIIIHEGAHGLVARAHGIKIKSTGLAILGLLAPIIPGAFVEPDEKQVAKQSSLVQYSIFAAGPVINIILAYLIIFTMPFVGYGIFTQTDLAPFESRITDPTGFTFNAINESYPAYQVGMKNGIITHVNGAETLDYQSFTDAIYGIRPNEQINITTNTTTYSITTTNSPDNPQRGFIGIRPVANERNIKAEYEWIKHPFYWLKGLIRWIFFLNLFVGLFNLLPLAILDGGRIFNTFLQNNIKNQITRKKIFTFISLFILIIIIWGLGRTYLPMILSLF